MTTARERWGWALLFGSPMGAGVALATARVTRAPPDDPLVLGAGLGTTVLVGALIAAVTARGSTNVDARDDR